MCIRIRVYVYMYILYVCMHIHTHIYRYIFTYIHLSIRSYQHSTSHVGRGGFQTLGGSQNCTPQAWAAVRDGGRLHLAVSVNCGAFLVGVLRKRAFLLGVYMSLYIQDTDFWKLSLDSKESDTAHAS